MKTGHSAKLDGRSSIDIVKEFRVKEKIEPLKTRFVVCHGYQSAILKHSRIRKPRLKGRRTEVSEQLALSIHSARQRRSSANKRGRELLTGAQGTRNWKITAIKFTQPAHHRKG